MHVFSDELEPSPLLFLENSQVLRSPVFRIKLFTNKCILKPDSSSSDSKDVKQSALWTSLMQFIIPCPEAPGVQYSPGLHPLWETQGQLEDVLLIVPLGPNFLACVP